MSNRACLRANAINRLGGKCVRCGFSDHRALQFDHIFGGGSIERKTFGTLSVVRRVLNGAKDVQLLCANCNCIKKAEEKEWNFKYDETDLGTLQGLVSGKRNWKAALHGKINATIGEAGG